MSTPRDLAIVDRAPVTKAIEQDLLVGTGRPGAVGRAPKPTVGQTAPEMPYWILYSLPGGDLTGPAGAPSADGTLDYQVTCVGERADQIEMLGDRVRRTMLRRHPNGHPTLSPAGVTVMEVTGTGFGGVDFDGPIGSSAEIFTVHVTNST